MSHEPKSTHKPPLSVVLASDETEARSLYGDDREHEDEQLVLVASLPAVAGCIVDSAVHS